MAVVATSVANVDPAARTGVWTLSLLAAGPGREGTSPQMTTRDADRTKAPSGALGEGHP